MEITYALFKLGTPWPEEKDEKESWNVDVFVQVLNEMAPNLNWSEVVVELDHPGFMVRDRIGLILLTKALLKGLRDTVFPIALLYKPWGNKEGQASWIKQILTHADVFCFAEYPHRSVNVEILKVPPEDGDKAVTAW